MESCLFESVSSQGPHRALADVFLHAWQVEPLSTLLVGARVVAHGVHLLAACLSARSCWEAGLMVPPHGPVGSLKFSRSQEAGPGPRSWIRAVWALRLSDTEGEEGWAFGAGRCPEAANAGPREQVSSGRWGKPGCGRISLSLVMGKGFGGIGQGSRPDTRHLRPRWL